MGNAASDPILQVLQRVVEDQRVAELPDQELLERFTAGRDQAAFLTLLRRHGPMVLSVCRALLPHEADAEDAFQATFLVLAHKAGSIRLTSALGCWLHGVAYRTARRAQAAFARRQKHERRASQREAYPPEDWTWREVQRVLHEELSGVSERYRAPLTLCYLQGRTLEEAAARLGLARGTLKARLERGRGLLRARLMRRGLGPAAALLTSAWPASARAGLPPEFLRCTAEAALRVAAGQAAAGLISPQAAALTEGVRNAMLISRLKATTASLAVLALVGLTLGGLASTAAQKPRAEEGRPGPALPAQAERPPAEQKAIADLQAAGGRIILDKTQPGEPVVGVYLLAHDVKEEHLSRLKEFKSLKTLVLPGLTDAALKELRELKGLERLRARSSNIEGALTNLGELTALRELDLDGFHESALKDLRGLKHLRVLKLSPWRPTGDGLKELKGLKELRRLELAFVFGRPDGERNVEAGLKELCELPRLEELVLEACVDDAGLGQAAKIKSLRALRLANSKVTDAGLAELKALTNLRRL
jgi:RNA polymerase sigma factor (sigma-70 family)